MERPRDLTTLSFSQRDTNVRDSQACQVDGEASGNHLLVELRFYGG